MEIRNALQKIENYLTVVSNLNKTILSEGSMSRDELLLMKKYLYTSIDRVEDIERLLVIDRKDEKSFTPTETVIQDPVPQKAKEIVEVADNSHIEEMEATLNGDEKKELEETVEEIHAEIEEEEKDIVGEINPVQVEEVKSEEILPVVNEEVKAPEEIKSTIEILPMIENIITEDFAFDELKETVAPKEEKVIEESKAEEKVIPFVNKKETKVETIAAKFGESKATTFAEEIANRKKEETTLFEQLNQKLNIAPQPQLFEMFDDEKEELHETFMSTPTEYEPATTHFDDTSHSYSNASVMVAEKKVEPVIEQMTPSSLNEVFRPQVVLDTVVPKTSKTFSESIALNDKFIFVRELFGNQFAEYEQGLKNLDVQSSFEAAQAYCRENLWNKFSWSNKTQAVDRFMELLQKRFA
jgi:hypothetical protein